MAGSNVGAGTTIPTVAGGFYYPNAPATVIPAIVGFTPGAGVENLLKISAPSAFYSGSNYNTATYPAPNRASSISSTTASLNNRSVTSARWNKPLLLAPNSGTDFTPSSANFVAPNWIYVARDGSNPTAWDSSYASIAGVPPTTAPATGTAGYDPVTQRYAYAIYDEGSTLDMNVAGSPAYVSGGNLTYSASQPYKYALAHADLTQLLPAVGAGSLTAAQQAAFVNAIVGWRNFATTGLAGTNIFPATYSMTQALATSYDKNNVLFNTSGFLGVAGNTFANNAISAGPNTASGTYNQTDNAFASRQQLLQFVLTGLGQNTTFTGSSGSNLTLTQLASLLPYLGTFSRDLIQPSYAPDPNRPIIQALGSNATPSGGNDMAGFTPTSAASQNILNPAFLAQTVSASFTRNDGTTAAVNEPLVKRRFALNRLAWLTYRGPSSGRTVVSPSSTLFTAGLSNTDYDIYLLENSYGIPASYLAQGNAANIYKYFGLSWVSDTRPTGSNGTGDSQNKWVYNHTSANPAAGTTTSPITSLPSHPASPVPSSAVNGATITAANVNTVTRIMTLSEVALAGREPDFFELLKAAMAAGSLGKAATIPGAGASLGLPADYQNGKDDAIDAQVIQIGANIIDQFDADSVPTRILFDDGVWPQAQEFRGVEDLPYLYSISSGWIRLKDTTPTFSTLTGGVSGGNFPGGQTPPAGGAITKTTSALAVANAGVAGVFQIPIIWNPHALNPTAITSASAYSATIGPRPTQFRIFAIDGNPNMSSPITPVASDPNAVTVESYARIITYTSGPSTSTPTTNTVGNTTTITYTQSGTSVSYYNGCLDDTANAGPSYTPASSGLQQTTSLTQANTEMDFGIPLTTTSPRVDLFREPTILDKPQVPSGSNLQLGASHAVIAAGTLHTLLTTQASNGNGGLEDSFGANDASANYTNAGITDLANKTGTKPAYLGIFLGAVPLAWNATNLQPYSTTTTNTTTYTIGQGTTNSVTSGPATPQGSPTNYIIPAVWTQFAGTSPQKITYRIQYADPTSTGATTNWCTYDEKYTGGFIYHNNNVVNTGYLGNFMTGSPQIYNFVDPRTSRFGAFGNNADPYGVNVGEWEWPMIQRTYGGSYTVANAIGWAGPTTGGIWLATNAAAQNATWTSRPDEESGFEASYNQVNTNTPPAAMGWYNTGNGGTFRPGVLCQNNPASTVHNSNNSFGYFSGATSFGAAGGNGTQPLGNIFFADPDGVVRRSMSGYVQPSTANVGGYSGEYSPAAQRPANSPSGIPLAWAYSYAAPNASVPGQASPNSNEVPSRPIVLNRPFRSVAELGHVFSGTPWRNIDFATPESGNSALLDVFCINDTNDPNGLVAGKINLNTRQAAVLQAVLASAYQDEFNPTTAQIGATGANTATANNIAKALVARTTDTNSTDVAAGAGPLRNVSELVGKWVSSVTAANTGAFATQPVDGGQSYAGFSGAATTVSGTAPSYDANATYGGSATPDNLSYLLWKDTTSSNYYAAGNVQRFRESVIRALANAGTTRVWNLMIDVIAQTGRFPSGTSSLSNFNVEGERRYWVHVAIDRYTGKILDEQVEEVKE